MRKRVRVLTVLLGLGLQVLGWQNAAFGWQPPEDGTLTEKQVSGYLAAFKEWTEAAKAAGKQAEGAGTLQTLQIAAATDAKFKEAIRKQGLTEEEFAWVGGKVWETWSGSLMAEMYSNSKKELEGRLKKTDEQIAKAREKVTRYEAALKSGKRVLSDEDKKQESQWAAEEVTSLNAEAKEYDTAAAEAAAAVAEAEKQAKEADQLAARPPADVDPADRADYVASKKEEAASARETAKEHRQSEAEARKSAADARTRAKVAAARVKDPEISTDDPADLKQRNTDGLAAAKAELEGLQQEKLATAQGMAPLEEMNKEMLSKLNQANLKLVQQHKDAIEAMMGGGAGK